MLMGQGRIVRHVISERAEWRHLDMIRRGRIERLVPAMAKVGPDSLKERLSVGNALGQGDVRVRLRRISVHLGGIEHAVTASEEQTRAAGLGAIFLRFAGVIRELPEHYQRGLLALANLGAFILPLLIRSPFAPLIALGLCSGPQTHGIDAPIWFLARCVDRREGIAARSVPRHAPCSYALL